MSGVVGRGRFEHWVAAQVGLTPKQVDALRLVAAFEVLLSRCEEARRRGAKDPLVTISSKRAGGNSRICTRRMLDQLGYTDRQRRAIHRLLAGSSSGWPGLFRLYCADGGLTPQQRQYARRQVVSFLRTG
ncbi:MAG: hypothetical protein M3537_08100 [Chloroflexota bacterium]|nr:hypothetical protein [Chloroflexota bacterium]